MGAMKKCDYIATVPDSWAMFCEGSASKKPGR